MSRLALILGLALFSSWHTGATAPPTTLDVNKLSWFLGRDYFVLRSGPVQMIVQADQADLGPAATYLLFDARNARQSARKEGAVNWATESGVGESALEVVLGGFPFTALGHRTETRWVCGREGVPSVRAVWWAGGVRVTEQITALAGAGIFERVIEVEGAHLAGTEDVVLRLRLPPGEAKAAGSGLVITLPGANLGVAAPGHASARAVSETKALEIGPLRLAPGAKTRAVTVLWVEMPGGDAEAFAARVAAQTESGLAEAITSTVAAWQAASRMTTTDATVQGLFDKARFQLSGMIAEDGCMNAGIFEYGAQWVRDTSNTALGALHAGQFEAARAALVRMLTQMVTREGVTMIANAFDAPDREQFDQMGELLHLLKAYRDWTGDDSLIREHRELLLALIERPFRPEFRDETGMVHNRREFWERTFTDAYELAYQTYVILGWREAADLADALGAPDRAPRWRTEATRTLEAMLQHPTKALVDDGHLIKRRTVAGEVADDPAGFQGFSPDVPLRTERVHRLLPDASMALPLALGVVDARGPVGRRTLDYLEGLWNTRWSDGGYDRYHTSSQPDQPGPWPFATTFILRAQHEAGLWERSRRSLEWLNGSAGGRTGAWFEEISSVRSQMRSCGLVPWTSGEVTLFVVRHYLGVRFEGDQLVVRPKLYPSSPPISADLRFREGRLQLNIAGNGRVKRVAYNGQALDVGRGGAVKLPTPSARQE